MHKFHLSPFAGKKLNPKIQAHCACLLGFQYTIWHYLLKRGHIPVCTMFGMVLISLNWFRLPKYCIPVDLPSFHDDEINVSIAFLHSE